LLDTVLRGPAPGARVSEIMEAPDPRFDVTTLTDLEPLFDAPKEASIVRNGATSTPIIGR
jgi:hypothetical protein